MGALHEGHLSLIQKAKDESQLVVCSIFINPTQFTDPDDLEKYPRPIDADIKLLEQAQCDILFIPSVSEIYPPTTQAWNINLDGLDKRLEGAIRPGHYQGVTQVVKILLDIVKPHRAFFGQKDYQQLLVINKMVQKLAIPTTIVMCPTTREADGLAMSSRNIHLSISERKNSTILFQTLQLTKQRFAQESIQQLTENAIQYLKTSSGIIVEYFQICDGHTLVPARDKNPNTLVALVAVRIRNTRLIDNIILK